MSLIHIDPWSQLARLLFGGISDWLEVPAVLILDMVLALLLVGILLYVAFHLRRVYIGIGIYVLCVIGLWFVGLNSIFFSIALILIAIGVGLYDWLSYEKVNEEGNEKCRYH